MSLEESEQDAALTQAPAAYPTSNKKKKDWYGTFLIFGPFVVSGLQRNTEMVPVGNDYSLADSIVACLAHAPHVLRHW